MRPPCGPHGDGGAQGWPGPESTPQPRATQQRTADPPRTPTPAKHDTRSECSDTDRRSPAREPDCCHAGKAGEQGSLRWPSPRRTRGLLLTFLDTWQWYRDSAVLRGILIN